MTPIRVGPVSDRTKRTRVFFWASQRLDLLSVALALTALLLAGCVAPHRSVEANPPPAPREFRAAWVATVANIDWPSKPGLPVAQQRAEIIALLDRARALNQNEIILQVRPAADAL